MILFITTMRHPEAAKDYRVCEQLLAATLRSVKSQTCSSFQIMVVGNRRPEMPEMEGVHYIGVNAPPAGRDLNARHFDRGVKLVPALHAAKEIDPDYIMFFDADDFLHRELVQYAETNGGPSAAGWFVRDGYTCNHQLTLFSKQCSPYPSDTFQERCGTSHIMRFSTLFEQVRDFRTDYSWLRENGGTTVAALLGDHIHYVALFEKLGDPLAPLPFRGAILRMATGENNFSHSFDGPSWPITRRMRRDFGMDPRATSQCLRDWSIDMPMKIWRKLSGKAGLRREDGQ